jgi:alkylated DNA repair dioxygenase AlkB
MYDLFNQDFINASFNDKRMENDTSIIDGLKYIPNFITKEEEKELLQSINNEIWLSDIKRRVQHYGYKYDYKSRNIDHTMYLGDIPHWSKKIANRLVDMNYLTNIPDQIIVNEYVPGQGIANHIDCEPCFGDTIITISLNSNCIMDFINVGTKQKVEVLLEPCSLVVINGISRYKWTHGIPARKVDVFNGVKIQRELRFSLTFRNVIFQK